MLFELPSQQKMWPQAQLCEVHLMWPSKLTAACVWQALHSYRGDVSRLTDLCRKSIYFEGIELMSTCLDAILHDEEVNSSCPL
jgi:hypothetical protein